MNICYIGNSIFSNKNIFNGYNIAIGGQLSSEIFFQVYNNSDFSQFDFIMIESIGNDLLTNRNKEFSKYVFEETINLLLNKGAKKIVIVELPLYENNIISKKFDEPIYLDILNNNKNNNVLMLADVYREQLFLNPLDNIHLNNLGSENLKQSAIKLINENDVYYYVIEETGNSLGARILSDTGIPLEFAEYLKNNSISWVDAYQKTINAGYENIINIVGSYTVEVIENNFL